MHRDDEDVGHRVAGKKIEHLRQVGRSQRPHSRSRRPQHTRSPAVRRGRRTPEGDQTRPASGLQFRSDPHGLVDQRLDDLRLGHRLDDLALDEDLALPVARCHAEVGFASLARTVDDAAHDGDPERHLHALQACGHPVGEGVDVDLSPSARRDTISSLRSRRLSDCRICRPTFTSSTGGADSDTRMVSRSL